MIYTLTLNPAIDLVMKMSHSLKVGELNRAEEQLMLVGGKGINVSRVLKTLGRPSTALGFVGGFTGQYIQDFLKNTGIASDFVVISQNTRINVKVLENQETELNGPSPKLTDTDSFSLLSKVNKLTASDLVIISGAVPKSFPLSYFEKMLAILKQNHVPFVLDTSGEPLLHCLKFQPFLIKPNKSELEEILNIQIHNEDELIACARKVIDLGAQNVMVSLGKDGAIFVNKQEVYKTKALKGKVINTVGAGDSTVAGFVDEYINTNSFEKSLKKAVLVGSATAFSTDLANKQTIDQLIKEENYANN